MWYPNRGNKKNSLVLYSFLPHCHGQLRVALNLSLKQKSYRISRTRRAYPHCEFAGVLLGCSPFKELRGLQAYLRERFPTSVKIADIWLALIMHPFVLLQRRVLNKSRLAFLAMSSLRVLFFLTIRKVFPLCVSSSVLLESFRRRMICHNPRTGTRDYHTSHEKSRDIDVVVATLSFCLWLSLYVI